MDPITLGLLFAVSILAGGLNAAAGGATFFTFPALVAAGLSPIAANATNYLALVPANIAALPAYRAELRTLGRRMVVPVVSAAFGGLFGAVLLFRLGGDWFASLVPYLMGFATLLFVLAPRLNRLVSRLGRGGAQSPLVAALLTFLFATYGGYFGAGLGQIMMAALVIAGTSNLHQANALKNVTISAISLLAVVVYAASGLVAWEAALVMAVGATIGGFVGGRVARSLPQQGLRWVVIVMGLFLTGYYFLA